MSKHTPGPWYWETSNGLFGADDTLVAAIHDQGPVSGADALLIAAAPDLLEACRVAHAMLNRIAQYVGHQYIQPAEFMQVEDAIAKAEGRDSGK